MVKANFALKISINIGQKTYRRFDGICWI